MRNEFARTELMLGREAMEKLENARVAVFGVGGVGGYVVEALARSGVGTFDLIDNDTVNVTNINRQIIATQETIGQYKVDAAENRIHSINPQAVVHKYKAFYLPDTADQFDFTQYDYVVDAIDTMTGKLELVCRTKEVGVPIICSMSAGNKLDPTAFRVSDISKTSMDPLARVMRKELRNRGINHCKVVYSQEQPLPVAPDAAEAYLKEQPNPGRRALPGSIAFVPSVVGLIIAGEVIKDLIGLNN